MQVLCRLIGHRRSSRYARRVAGGWVSHCRLCGEALVRRGPKSWHPAATVIETEAPLPLFEWDLS